MLTLTSSFMSRFNFIVVLKLAILVVCCFSLFSFDNDMKVLNSLIINLVPTLLVFLNMNHQTFDTINNVATKATQTLNDFKNFRLIYNYIIGNPATQSVSPPLSHLTLRISILCAPTTLMGHYRQLQS